MDLSQLHYFRTAARTGNLSQAARELFVTQPNLSRSIARLDGRADPEWLLTLLSVLPLNTYTLEEWNEALSQAAGRRIFCPSYRTLSDYLHRLVLGVQ